MNKDFWKAALIRAARTVAQAALALIPAAARIDAVDWLTVISTAALAGVVSILTSIATGLPEAQIKQQRPPDEDSGDDGDDFDDYSYESVDEAECPVRVFAYNNYDENGDPIAEKPCEECDLTSYLDGDADGGDDDGDA